MKEVIDERRGKHQQERFTMGLYKKAQSISRKDLQWGLYKKAQSYQNLKFIDDSRFFQQQRTSLDSV